MEVSQTGHRLVNVRRLVAVGLKFDTGIVPIQSHSLVAKHVTILALMTNRENVTHSSVLVRFLCFPQNIFVIASLFSLQS